MDYIMYLGVLAVAGVYMVVRAMYHLHMYQLNSYRIERYFRFLKVNYKKIIPLFGIVFIIVSLFLSYLYSKTYVFHEYYIVIFWIAVVLIRVYPLLFKKVRTKKALVYTMRVKRIIGVMMVLSLVLIFGIPGLMGLQGELESILIINVIIFTTPLLMVSANFILIPFERYLRFYYYNDAKNMLRAHKELKIIGITGSYGKTSTKFILEKILSQQYTTLITPHSYNTILGVIRTIREKLNRSHEVFIVEMGAKQKGDIKEICDLVKPYIGIITAVGPQHLETFGSLNTIIDTKFELVLSLPKTGKGFVNGDSNNILEGIKRYNDIQYITYGTNENNVLKITEVTQSPQGSIFTISTPGGKKVYTTRLLGMHNILNIAGAIGVAMELGMSYEKIATGVKEIKPVEHRLELKKQGDYFILDDAFNSNPTGAKSALDVLEQFKTGQKIIMTPGMIELGEMDDEIHYEFGKQIAKVCDIVVLIGMNKTRSIVKGLEAEGYNMEKVHVLNSVYEGFRALRNIVQKGDIVLIENDLPDNFNE